MRARYLILNVFFLLLSVFAFSQIDTASIYHTARHVPFWQSRNVDKLSAALAKNCSLDEETVLAFSYWICKNLKLDYAAIEKRPAENKTLKKVLRSRKALSDGYVKLFVEMCKTQKIAAIYVPGYAKDYDYMPGDTLYRAEYAWALVNLSDEWYIMDLAAASSKVVAVVSPMSKVLWTLFKVPYASHLMAVRDFNPTYLYMDPVKNASKHIPVVDEFQLMQYPMSISYYMVGDTLMQGYLENYPEKSTVSTVLNDFSAKSAMEKYIFVADKSEENNPANKYTKALYYYYAVKNFYNTYYIQERGKIFAPLEESEKVWNYSKIADSLFVLASQANSAEMAAKQARSEKWKRDLIDANKVLATQMSTQAKVNTQQTRALEKLNAQNKKTQTYILKYKGKYVLRDIVDMPRPMIQNKDNLDEGKANIQACRESMERCNKLLAEYDSLYAFLSADKLDTVYKQQQNASALCNRELASLSRYLDRKGSNLSLVYYSDKYVLKKPYFEVFAAVGDINDTYTDPMVEVMNDKIPMLNELIQDYIDETISGLKSLKDAKQLLANDYGEDDLYEKIALAFNKQLDAFSKQMDDMISYNQKLSDCLSEDVTMYKDMVKMLQNDNSMENYRHKEYMAYRKSIKQAENDKIKYYQGTIHNYQKLIGKAINVK